MLLRSIQTERLKGIVLDLVENQTVNRKMVLVRQSRLPYVLVDS